MKTRSAKSADILIENGFSLGKPANPNRRICPLMTRKTIDGKSSRGYTG
jgi:hypothetical protein